MLRILLSFLLVASFACPSAVHAQAGVLNPADPDVIFTATNRPALPAYNNISKWGHTQKLNWSGSTPFNYGFKSYYYKGMAFRVKFPKTYQHGVADGKKYPVFLFLHGLGERGDVYDNEYQLLHGGQSHARKVDDGTFDGFLVYSQSQSGYHVAYFAKINEIVDSLAKYVKADLDRVVLGGLSSGGQGVWDYLADYSKTFAAAIPISAAQVEDKPTFNRFTTLPIWTGNGGLDGNPDPGAVTEVVNYFRSLGGTIRQSYYPTEGHGCWNSFWAQPDYYPTLATYHKANPAVYFGRTEFCAGDEVKVRMGLHPGFSAYEWQKDGITIPGAVASDYTATQYGVYKARFRRTGTSAWSEWSPKPVVVQQKAATVTPPIQVQGLRSKVLPAPDGSTTVTLAVPSTYETYEWRRVADNALVSDTSILAAVPGSYKVKVVELYGCSSSFSEPFTVLNVSGAGRPDNPSNLSAMAVSNSAIRLDWNDNPTPVNNETGFEVYGATKAGGPYKLLAITAADVLTYTNSNLNPNTAYYYLVRAINNNGGSDATAEVTTKTATDTQAPTAPAELRVTSTNRYSVSLDWEPSSDDLGVVNYDVYVNGSKAYSTTETEFTVYNLTQGQAYTFFVKARDYAGNASPASNQVASQAIVRGLNYKYYHGTWNNLPDFNTLTPVYTGTTATPDISLRSQNDAFGFLWEGYVIVPVDGTYYFRLRSDDGSRLWLGALNGSGSPYSFAGTPLINHDGAHGITDKTSAALTLKAGVYPIAIGYFDRGGDDGFGISWSTPQTLGAFVTVPATAFQDAVTSTELPVAPANVVVTPTAFDKVSVSWADNSNNESGFELWRSTSFNKDFAIVATAAANATSMVDSFQLKPATTYYYRLRSVGITGVSDFVPVNNVQARWDFNNNYADGSNYNRGLTPNNGPTFDAADKKEGTHSLNLDGINDDVTITTAAGDYLRGGYTAKTVAFWMKADVTISNRAIFDLGGSDDGLTMAVYSNYLIAGIASNNTRRNVMTPYSSLAWNHIALVYSANSMKIYVNASLKATLALPFSSVTATSDASMIGDDVGSNALGVTLGQFDGRLDNFWIIGSALNDAEVGQLINGGYMYQAVATTLPLPAAPAAPVNLQATTKSPAAIGLAWTDNSVNETGFDIWRSLGTDTSFRIIGSMPSGATSYADSGLFANVSYRYKVLAKGVGGNSAFSNIATATTANNLPVLQNVASFTMRYDAQKSVNVVATDADGEALQIAVPQMPAFASFVNNGNGSATIAFSPDMATQGVYPVSVIVTDAHNGADTIDFNLTVNDNYTPVVTAVNDVEIEENKSGTINLSATDADGSESLQWTAQGLPAFATLSGTGATASIALKPNFAQAGNYPVTVTTTDVQGGSSSVSFVIKVANIEPATAKWMVNILHRSMPPAPAPWNNVTALSAPNLKDEANQTTNVGFQFLTTAWNTHNGGAITGNNSGVFPDGVLRDYYYFGIFGAPQTVSFKLTGLDTAYRYNLTLHAGSSYSGVPDNGSTVFTINANAQTLYVQNNTKNTANFVLQKADADGSLTVNMSKAANTPIGYLNGFVLEKVFEDGTLPVMPANLQAAKGANGSVVLTWNDIAYNELKYSVYRSASAEGEYILLNPNASNNNATSFTDTAAKGQTAYFYKVAAVNNVGASNMAGAVSITTDNRMPVVAVASNVYVKSGQSITVAFNATDDAGETLAATVNNLPKFAQVATNAAGNGTIVFAPQANDLGIYKDITIRVTDNNGGVTEKTIELAVSDNATRSIFINVGGDGNVPQGKPWNNLFSYPFAGYTISNLRDDQDQATAYSFKLIEQWTQGWKGGMITSNNSGIYPDNVLQSSIYMGGTETRQLQFTGLNQSKRYNVAVLSSNNAGFDATFTLASGNQSKTFNARYNSTRTVQLNGLTPNAAGVIDFSMTKAAGANYMYLNAVILQEYDAAETLLRPTDMMTEINAPGSINISWSDRSTSETGFEVWRATSGSQYQLFATTAADVTSLVDNSAVGGTRYWYKVRAIGTQGRSDFSNTANTRFGKNRVLVNLNLATPEAGGWNNTNNTPQEGVGINNLKNEVGNSTGISMVNTNNWGGYFDLGMTGGILPDNVMLTSWWIEGNSQPGTMKLSNLDQSKRYRIGFMGSSSWEGDFTASYTINGKTVLLNSYKNNSKIVYLEDVVTNEAGEIHISMGYLTTTRWSFLSAIIIESYEDDSDKPLPLADVTVTGNRIMSRKVAAVEKNTLTESTVHEIKAYPNPFTASVNVSIQNAKPGHYSLKVFSLNGSPVMMKDLGVINGSSTINIGSSELQRIAKGVYMLQVIADGEVQQTIKLMKL